MRRVRVAAVCLVPALVAAGCTAGRATPARLASAALTPPSIGTSPSPAPRRPGRADPRIAAAGDIACDVGDAAYNDGAGDPAACRMRATADLLRRLNPSWVLPLGDLQYQSGAIHQFETSYGASWGTMRARTRPVPGNHEYGVPGAEGYFEYFGAIAGARGKGWYSYDVGRWHLIALNANCGAIGGCGVGSPEERWLRADLAKHSAARCTLAYWHQPRWSSGLHGDDPAYDAFWRALYRAGADVVLNGHDHDYERFAPQSPAGVADAPRGIREFVVGTGGESHYPIKAPALTSEFRLPFTYGVLALTLHATSYDWEFAPVDSRPVRDSGTASCH
ncbi:MAG: metallophosphoesterase [Mycobacteriales bacterium]